MRRTTPARSARDARRPARAIHLRAASVVALAALGVGVAPALASPIAGADGQKAVVTAGTSSDASDNGDTSDDGGSENGTQSSDTQITDGPESSKDESNDAETDQSSDKGDDQDASDPAPATTGTAQSAKTDGSNTPAESKGSQSAKLRPSTLDLNRETTTRLSLKGFTPGTEVSVTAPEGVKAEPQRLTVDKNGCGHVALQVNPSVAADSYEIAATGGTDQSATAELTIVAKHSIKVQSVQAGHEAHITGAGFPAEDPVTVQVDKTDKPTKQVVKPVDADVKRGSFTSDIEIPPDTDPDGKYTVTAKTASGKITESAPLTVTAADDDNDDPEGPGSDKPTATDPDPESPTAEDPGGSSSGSSSSSSSSSSGPSSSDSSSSSSSSSSTTSTTPSDSGSRSASTTSEVPPATSTRDSSKEIELSAPSDDSSSKNTETEKSEKKDTAEKPTKDEDSEKAKDEDKKTSDTPQETSDQPVSDQQSDATEAAATMDDDDTTSSGPTTVTTEDDGGGPLVKLFSSIGGEDASGMNRIRQVFVATLGVAFLTAAGFTTASWLSRRSGTHSARAGLRQLFHRRH
ncbi:hypothetical protein [Brachybacterium sp. NPDC056505]|uniref:hypothetical protein n=1 Tax=Brachybacterium sp. NPDC056505 TaxID=3345843 RepID=UPI003670603C